MAKQQFMVKIKDKQNILVLL